MPTFEAADFYNLEELLTAEERRTRDDVRNVGFGKLEVTVVSGEKESPHFQTVFATGSK